MVHPPGDVVAMCSRRMRVEHVGSHLWSSEAGVRLVERQHRPASKLGMHRLSDIRSARIVASRCKRYRRLRGVGALTPVAADCGISNKQSHAAEFKDWKILRCSAGSASRTPQMLGLHKRKHGTANECGVLRLGILMFHSSKVV